MYGPLDSLPPNEVRGALEALLRGLDEAGDAISVTDASGVIRFANQAAAQIIGRPLEAVVGRHAWEVDPSFTPERFRANWVELEQRGAAVRERSWPDATGRRRHFEARMALTQASGATYVITFMRDVTAAREAAAALREEQARAADAEAFRSVLLRILADAVIVTDPQMRIREYSGSAETLYGWRRDEVLGRVISEALQVEFPAGDRDVHRARLARGEPTRAYVQARRKDGALLDVDLCIDLVRDANGQVTHFLSVARDITVAKTTERELREALQKVKRLSGLLPICAWCKKVRNDAGYWQEIGRYLGEHSDAQLTHGICPECAKSWER